MNSPGKKMSTSRQRPRVTDDESGATRSQRRSFRELPLWIQAIAALMPPTIGLLTFLGLNGGDNAPPTTTLQSPSDVDLRVNVHSMSVRDASIEAAGTYTDLRDSETVVVMLRVVDSADDGPWLTAEAERSPTEGEAASNFEQGAWQVSIPKTEDVEYDVSVAIIPARTSGGFLTSLLEQLREAGPDAESVVEATPVQRVGP